MNRSFLQDATAGENRRARISCAKDAKISPGSGLVQAIYAVQPRTNSRSLLPSFLTHPFYLHQIQTMPKPKNSLIAGLKKFGRALSPRKRSKSQGQQSGGSSPGASPGASPSASASQLSTTQVVANNSGRPTNASNSRYLSLSHPS